MSVTRVSDLSNIAVVKYMSDFLIQAFGQEIWAQFVEWKSMQEGASGTSFDFPAFSEMDIDLTVLDEESDVVPVRMVDDNLVVTPAMYGRAVVTSEELRFRGRSDVRSAGAKLVSQNRVRSIDRLIRNGVLGGSNIFLLGGQSLRTDLDATSDKVTYNYLRQLHALASAMDIEPIGPENTFIAPIHPLLQADIQDLTEYKEIQYRRPVNLQGKEINAGVQPFIFAGFHFIPHKWGKIYMSGGTLAQATTLSADVAAGATSITVASAAGLAVSDHITLGTLEATDAETVRITVVAGTTLTVAGVGNLASNLGCRYAHSSGDAVTEAAFAAAIPVIGRNSIKGVYGANTGRMGTPVLSQNLDILQRFIYQGWKWHGGVTIWPRYVIRGEVAVGIKIPMAE